MAQWRPGGSAQSDGDAGGMLRRLGAWRGASSTGKLPLFPGRTALSHPSNCMTWRRNERPDGDNGGNGDRKGSLWHKGEGGVHPRRNGDRAGGGLDDNGAATGGNPPILPLGTEASATN